jgi:membrane-anchored protein YejM (alkaline phosphatase superfamily)
MPALLITTVTRIISQRLNPDSSFPTYVAAVLSGGITTLLMYANAKIFSLYGMFFNGFIINLLVTPGGIESLGGSSASDVAFALIATGFISLQAILLWLLYRYYLKKKYTALSFTYLPLSALLLTFIIHFGFAIDRFSTEKLHIVAETIPFYQTVSAKSIFKALGFKPKRDSQLKLKGKINYPMNPLKIEAPAKPLNIIWLTSESWRADTLNETVMPKSWSFAKNAANFTRNYSTGNGTRMGVFGMFMGIPGNYWFPFLELRRGAAIIDVLQQQQYQMRFYTSAKFTYPEFDKTIFAQVPSKLLHDDNKASTGWENDRNNVDRMLSFIDQRDPSKPFFTFMFFESPHARYYFPPESVIARPYRDDINYATIDKKTFRDDITPIKNRYINSVHHLDMQFGRIFDYLKDKRLLDSTIVILIGDHGEEFMEHGFWGHNSTFVDEQVLTPLVIFAPGMKPFVQNNMTSHMDVIPTIMPLLGVINPTDDYATGYNLFGEDKRKYTYVSDWDKVTYIDHEVKIVQPVNTNNFMTIKVSKASDESLSDSERTAILQKKQGAMLQLIKDLGKFFKKKESAAAN